MPRDLVRPLRRELALAALALFPLAAPAGAQTFVAVNSPTIGAHVAFSTGAAWVDFDGDGDLDLFVATAFGADNHDVLYRNDGGDTFTPVSRPMTQTDGWGVCSTWADYDNDGVIDAFVSGLSADSGVVYHGLGGGAFAAGAPGIVGAGVQGAGCAWGDYDNDGYVDLVVAVIDGVLGMTGGNRLFHNDGDGSFTEVTSDPAVTNPDTHHHPTWADFDGDGDLDLFFATGTVGSTDTDRLYRNQLVETATATFTPITTGVLATDLRDSQVLSWADYDNDGDLDCYAINYTSVGNQLYRNDGAAGFTKITTGTIVTDTGPAHGVAWGDFDNDGDLDVYVARDNQQTNRYYRNNGNGTFTRVTSGPHVTQVVSNYAAAAADYDGDGDLDLFVPTARSEGPSVLFRNDLAPGAHWTEVRLVGTRSNRSAIGARVRVRAVIGGAPRWQLREIAASTGYGGMSALDAHVGLGDATTIDSLIVEWPSGLRDTLTQLGADALRTIVEGSTLAVPAGPRPRRPGASLAVTPNPCAARAHVRFRLGEPGHARVYVIDVQGRVVATLAAGAFAGGWHAADLDAAPLRSGVYLLRLETRTGVETRRLVVLK